MIYVLGVLSGNALQLGNQSDDDFSSISMDDPQLGFVPWYSSPFKAWQKRDAALDELSRGGFVETEEELVLWVDRLLDGGGTRGRVLRLLTSD